MKRYFTLLFTLLLCAYGRSQQHFIQYTDQNGLPSNLIYFIHQDKNGFIWIATDKGVCRFDGQQFKLFTSNDGLGTNEVYRIAEDMNGRVFFYSSDQTITFYQKGKIHKSTELNTSFRIGITTFSSLRFSSDNWFCLNAGFKQDAFEVDKKTHITTDPNLHPAPSYTYRSAYGLKTIYQSTIDLLKKELTENGIAANEFVYKPYRIEFYGDTLLLLSKKFISIYKIKNKVVEKLKTIPLGSSVNVVEIIKPGILSVSHFNNSIRIINITNLQQELEFQPASFSTLSFIDNENNYWLGTYNDGVFLCLNPFIKVVNQKNGLCDDKILSMSVFKNHVFVGHPQGKISWFPLASGSFPDIKSIQIPSSIVEFNNISELVSFKDTLLVAGNNTLGLVSEFINKPGQWKNEYLLEGGGSFKDIEFIGDTIFVITSKAIYFFNNKNRIKAVPQTKLLKIIRQTAIEKSWNNEILIGTTKGLFALKPDTDSNFRIEPALPQLEETITSIATHNYTTAIGTDNNGVLIKSSAKETVLKYPIISSNNINKVVWDDSASLWICTAHGINFVEWDRPGSIKRIRTYNESTGLPSDYTTDVIRYGNTCYIGTNRGIAIITINEAAGIQPPVLYSEQSTEKVYYPYGQKIPFEFFGFSYKSLGEITYKTRLLGTDSAWMMSKEGTRELELMPPGDYTLEVKAVDRFGQESESMFFPVTVEPQWHQQSWVKAIAFLFIVSVVVLFVRDYYKTKLAVQEKEFENKIALEEERKRISSNLHDDIGATLSSINIYTNIAKEELDKEPYLQEISKNIQDVVGKLDDLVWSINPKYDSIASIANRIYSYAEPLARAQQIKLHFTKEGIDEPESIALPVKNTIYLVAKELINNAFKHSRCNELSIRISVKNRELFLQVKDNGKGLNTELLTGSQRNGLTNIQQHIKELNGIFKAVVEDGTTISISVPV